MLLWKPTRSSKHWCVKSALCNKKLCTWRNRCSGLQLLLCAPGRIFRNNHKTTIHKANKKKQSVIFVTATIPPDQQHRTGWWPTPSWVAKGSWHKCRTSFQNLYAHTKSYENSLSCILIVLIGNICNKFPKASRDTSRNAQTPPIFVPKTCKHIARRSA